MSRMKKERSCSGGTFEFQPSSPSSSRKHLSSKEKSSTASTSRLRYLQHTNVPLVDLTIFHIPGLDVKVKIFTDIAHILILYIYYIYIYLKLCFVIGTL